MPKYADCDVMERLIILVPEGRLKIAQRFIAGIPELRNMRLVPEGQLNLMRRSFATIQLYLRDRTHRD